MVESLICPFQVGTIYFFKKINLFIYLFLAALGIRCCAQALSSCSEQGPLFIAVRGPTAVASPAAEHGLQAHGLSSCGSQAPERRLSSVEHGPRCSAACGIFPDQGTNPCPLHWQVDSQPLRHQGSPDTIFLMVGGSRCRLLKNLQNFLTGQL